MLGFRKTLSVNGLDLIGKALNRAKAPVRFWWRDDDASAYSAPLERLLSLSREYRAPVSLAVIPVRLQASLVDAMRDHGDLDILVHGWAHLNHAIEDEKKCEFPITRPVADIRSDLSNALNRLREAFPRNMIPVFVPPWNLFPPELAPLLKECGYTGLSTISSLPPGPVLREDGLRQSDCHLNLVAWKERARLADVEMIAKRISEQIRAGSNGPFCIVTHHGDHDEEIWAYCAQLWKLLANHRNAEIVPARAVFC